MKNCNLITRSVFILVLLLILCGCRVELQHNLTEKQANEIMLVMIRSGIDAAKSPDDQQKGRWMVLVDEKFVDKALDTLIRNELPREKSDGFCEIFEKEGFIPTDIQQRVRFVSALAGELQETLEADDSILKARVHIHIPYKSKYEIKKTENSPATASVYIKVPAESVIGKRITDDEIKLLIANSVDNLTADNVTVVRSLTNSFVPDQFNTVDSSKMINSIQDESKLSILIISVILLTVGSTLLIVSLVVLLKRQMAQKNKKELAPCSR